MHRILWECLCARQPGFYDSRANLGLIAVHLRSINVYPAMLRLRTELRGYCTLAFDADRPRVSKLDRAKEAEPQARRALDEIRAEKSNSEFGGTGGVNTG